MGNSKMSLTMKLLWAVMIVLVTALLYSLYEQYSDVDRFQKRAIANQIKKEIGKFDPAPNTPIPEYPKSYEGRTWEKVVPTPTLPEKKHMPQYVSDDCPAWILQSPLWIALGLWIELFKNLVTLLLSFITAFFMFAMYKKDKGEEVDVEVIE